MDERVGELTGERLDDASPLHRADLARHRAAYRFAAEMFARAAAAPAMATGSDDRILDLGCGTGYGAVLLAQAGQAARAAQATRSVSGAPGRVFALDQVAPAERSRGAGVFFVRGGLERLPFADRSMARVVSFQVIEHLADPTRYLAEIARILAPGGALLLSTPNRLESDGENPFHLREYEAAELAVVLAPHFGRVELRGIHATGAAAEFQRARLRRIRAITRLDPLGLRRRLPRPLVDWLFARFARLVRRSVAREGKRREGRGREVVDDDYRIAGADPDCLDLLAIARDPRPRAGVGGPG